jgi:hypothetical protein
MDVYLIPIGRHRDELYCEPSGDATGEETSSDEAPPGVVGRLRRRFAEMIRAADERQRAPGHRASPAPGMFGRAQERMMAWVAERIAEQRLLWRLRRETTATAVHPQDMPPDEAITLVREILQRDSDRHRRWLVVDAVLLVLSGALAIVPGPNLVAYYFAFRVWGHWLSMRGAGQGLHRVHWMTRPCPVLGELRDLAVLEAPVRHARVRDVAARLQLPHLAAFFERLVVQLRHA